MAGKVWVRLLSGAKKGHAVQQERTEAENNVATGFARYMTLAEVADAEEGRTDPVRVRHGTVVRPGQDPVRVTVEGDGEIDPAAVVAAADAAQPPHPTDAPEQNGGGATGSPAPEGEQELPGEVRDEEPAAAAPQPETPAETPAETDGGGPETPTFTLRHVGGGKWNVLDANGTAVNESPLTKVQAEDLLEAQAQADAQE